MRRTRLVFAVAAVMAVLMAVSAAPAMARDFDFDNNDNIVVFDGFHHNGFFTSGFLGQDIGNESETGNVDLSFSVQSTGNSSNQCVTPLQFGNTGSNQNAQGFTSFGSPVDNNGFFFPFDVFGTDVDFEGSTFEFTPVLNASCNQSVEQSSAASSF